MFALLLRAAAQTLLTLGRDPKRLGAELGITTVLHTWTRELTFHPHVHCIVTAGGLTADRRRWRPARQRYLFPVRVLGALFRGKVLAALQRSVARGELSAPDPVATRRTLGALHQTPWLVYVKRPFGGATRLFQYLGRYTRVGISNHRLVAVTPDAVTFRTKDGRTVTVHPEEFVRRLLLHVLPRGFVKIRHAGLFAPRQVSTTLPVARALLGDRPQGKPPPVSPSPWATLLRRLTGFDVTQCPRCATSPLERRVFVPHLQRPPP